MQNIPPLVKDLHFFLGEFYSIRSRGRLATCDYISYDVANPLLISRDSFLSELMVVNGHKCSKDMGVSSTMATLRNSGLWLPRGRPFIRKFFVIAYFVIDIILLLSDIINKQILINIKLIILNLFKISELTSLVIST